MTPRQVRITFLPSRIEGFVPQGITLHEAAALLGVTIERPCGGIGSCGKDIVQVRNNYRLTTMPACRTRVDEDLEIILPSLDTGTIRTTGGFYSRNARNSDATRSDHDTAARSQSTAADRGVALDLGTTTIEASLVDLSSGSILGYSSILNPLISYGHDVMSRIKYSVSHDGALGKMHEELIATVNMLTHLLLSNGALDIRSVARISVAGNATMQHILLNIPVHAIGMFPYTTVLTEPRVTKASELHIDAHENALVTTFPCVSPFVGGDIVAGLIGVELEDTEKPALFIDLGTNGEIVLLTRTEIIATSCAAGPCFEGMSISSGMRASTGAVESVTLGEEIHLKVIGGVEPRGICGSGLLELVSELLRTRVVNSRGRLQSASSGDIPEKYRRFLGEINGKRHFWLTDKLSVSQADIRQVQLARAAIRTAVEFLISEGKIESCDIENIIIAGGFGYHADKDALFRVGLLPPSPDARISFVGNSSLEGARRMLVDRRVLNNASGICLDARVIDLTNSDGFEASFSKRMRFD